MTGELPSSTPEKSGNNKYAGNKSTDKRKRQPQKKLKPTHVDSGKETPWWIDVSDGVGLVGSLVIWAEMIDCHVISQLIFYFAALVLCYVGICHLIYQFLKKYKWSAKFSVFLWFVLALITGWFVYENSRPSPIPTNSTPPFSVVRTASFTSTRTGSEHFWFVHSRKVGNEIPPQFEMVKSPINYLVYLRFSNLKDVPIEMDSYSVEMKTADGKWVECPTIDVRDGAVFWRSQLDFQNSIRLNFDTNNIAAVIETPITPHHTVEGWAFCDMRGISGLDGEARLRIREMSGAERVETISNYPNDKLDIAIDRQSLETIPGHWDISAYPIMVYSNSFH